MGRTDHSVYCSHLGCSCIDWFGHNWRCRSNYDRNWHVDFLGVIAVTGGILSWWKDAISGMLLFLTSVGLGIHISCYAGHSKIFAWVLIGLPYLVASILMVSSWRLSK